VQKTLDALIKLQEFDNRLDELLEERGDLPHIVTEFEIKLSDQNEKLKEIEESLELSKKRIKEITLFESESKDRLEKYNEPILRIIRWVFNYVSRKTIETVQLRVS